MEDHNFQLFVNSLMITGFQRSSFTYWGGEGDFVTRFVSVIIQIPEAPSPMISADLQDATVFLPRPSRVTTGPPDVFCPHPGCLVATIPSLCRADRNGDWPNIG